MKKVVVFGSTGKTGKQIVKECLKAGYIVTAFTRRKEYPIEDPHLEVIVGDIENKEDIAKAIASQDAIVSAVGNSNYDEPRLVVVPTVVNIIETMSDSQRLISVSAISMMQFDEKTLFADKQSPELSRRMLYPRIDHFSTMEFLNKQKKNWLMVCPPYIQEGDADGNFVIKETYFPKNAEMFISAGNIGQFIAIELEENKFTQTRIGIGAKKK